MRGALALLLAAAMVSHAEDAVDFVPESARRFAVEGSAAFAKGDMKAARRAFEQVLELAPGNLLATLNLGVVEFHAGDTARAEELLKRTVRLRMETAPAWLTLGIIYMDANRLDEAHAALAQAVLYDPGSAKARNFLGVVFGRRGWTDAAQDQFRRAVEIDPTYADAQYNLAAFYLDEKPPAIELARRHYVRAIELGAKPDEAIEKALKSAPPPQ